MKTNMTRIVCLLLALFLCFGLFAACGKEKEEEKKTESVASTTSEKETPPQEELLDSVLVQPDAGAPYTLLTAVQGNSLVIMVPDGNTTALQVAENTNVSQFLTYVVAKDGYAICVWDGAGNQVIDLAAIITDGSRFEVINELNNQVEVTMNIRVVKQEVISSTVEQQETINQYNSQVQQGNSNVVKPPVTSNGGGSSQGGSGSSNGGTSSSGGSGTTTPVVKTSVTLSTIWYDSYVGSSQSAAAWQNTFKSMEAKGYTTTVHTINASSAVDTIVKEVQAGKTDADIYEVSLKVCRDLARKKVLCNWLDSSTITASDFQNGGTKSVTFGSNCYGISLTSGSGVVYGVIYNKDLIKKYASDYDLQKLYKENKWDFETFRTVAKLCTRDTDGDGKTDIYGVTSNNNIIGIMLTANAGGTALSKNGRIEPTMCNDAGVAALEFCKALFKTDRSWKYFADIKTAASNFCTGTYAMFASNLYFYSLIAPTATFKFDFVHAPMGPDYGKYVDAVYDASLYVVPKTNAARLKELGVWMNNVRGVSATLLDLEGKTMTNSGFSQDAVTIYKWCKNNMQADFSTGAFSSAVSSQVDSSVTNVSSSPAKVMASIKSQAQKELDDYYANLY